MNRLLAAQEKFNKFPFGKKLFSYFVARQAPYFLSIRPKIADLKSNYCRIEMRKRRSVENHIGTVHAIAMCNICELAGGLCIEATIPSHLRWIPIGMNVSYLKKAETDLIAICELSDVDWTNSEIVNCFVSVRDTNQIEVMTANIEMKISVKPTRIKGSLD